MKLTNWLMKLLCWPICRAYARLIIRDRPADVLYRLLCSLQFRRTHRYLPNFKRPRRFSEKLWAFMLFDRNPQLTMVMDKLSVRTFVKTKSGSKYLIPLLWSGNKPEEIPFHELPAKYVIKTNHGCGYNIFVKDKAKIDKARIQLQLKKWLNENYCQDKYLGMEWGYKNIRPTIIIESYLEEKGKTPIDYKFYCFSGRVEFLSVHFDRFEDHKYRSFDRDFEPYDLQYDLKQWSGECIRPANFKEMVHLVESLAKDFDFMRVDLYSLDNSVYFGELTPYPGGGSARFLPASRDYFLGEKWKLKQD